MTLKDINTEPGGIIQIQVNPVVRQEKSLQTATQKIDLLFYANFQRIEYETSEIYWFPSEEIDRF